MKWKKKIFLSHRASDPDDEDSAEKIKAILEKLAPPTVEVFVSGRDIHVGDNWRTKVFQEMSSSRYLIFLYTDPKANWNWCHFEAGWFLSASPSPVGSEDSPDKRIIVLHPNSLTVPSTLSDYQTIRVPANRKLLADFLTKLFVEDDPVRQLWLSLEPDTFDVMAGQIAEQVGRMACDSSTLVPSLVLRGKEKPSSTEIPGSYTVEIEDRWLQELFNQRGTRPDNKPWTWQDVMPANLLKQVWVGELTKNISGYITDERQPQRINGAFEAPSGRIYRPVLHQIGRSGVGYSFEVLFLESASQDKTDPVSSFGDLMERLVDLIQETEGTDAIKFLAYTPALGFLTETETRWDRLRAALELKVDQIEMICLDRSALASWHGCFVDKPTARDIPAISPSLIEEANEVSEKLVKMLDDAGSWPRRKRPGDMPGFYFFKNRKRAIVVTPLGVPLPTDDAQSVSSQEYRDTKVQMVGLDTTVPGIIRDVDKAFARFNR